jgi:hypothetical protein
MELKKYYDDVDSENNSVACDYTDSRTEMVTVHRTGWNCNLLC